MLDRPDGLMMYWMSGWTLSPGATAMAYVHSRATSYVWPGRSWLKAPGGDRAHLWLAINLGRSAEIKGVMRARALVTTIREESGTVLRLNPANVEGLILAGGLAAELPALMGGDRPRPRRCSSGRSRPIPVRPAGVSSSRASTSLPSDGVTPSASSLAWWTSPRRPICRDGL